MLWASHFRFSSAPCSCTKKQGKHNSRGSVSETAGHHRDEAMAAQARWHHLLGLSLSTLEQENTKRNWKCARARACSLPLLASSICSNARHLIINMKLIGVLQKEYAWTSDTATVWRLKGHAIWPKSATSFDGECGSNETATHFFCMRWLPYIGTDCDALSTCMKKPRKCWGNGRLRYRFQIYT